jgi:hypothetical protein
MAGQPSDVEVTRTVEYRLGVGYQLNEMPGKLRPLVGSTGSYSDKKAQIEDRFDDLTAQEKVQRNGDTPNVDISAERRWIVKPRTQQLAPLIDRDDAISTKLDLQSPAAIQTAKAIRRAQADRWVQGFYGNAYSGEDGATAVPFKAANIMAANTDEGGNVGVTLNKLIAMRVLMQQRLVDLEEETPIMLYTARQLKDLLKIAQIQSRDYNPQSVLALQNGQVTSFLGFTFIPTELGNAAVYPASTALTVQAGTGYRLLPVFVKSGLHWGTWTEFFGKVTERNDKNHSMQIYAETCGAMTRLNEDKCFAMACNEA